MNSCFALMLNELSSTTTTKRLTSYEEVLLRSDSSTVVPLAAALIAANWSEREDDSDSEQDEIEEEETSVKRRRISTVEEKKSLLQEREKEDIELKRQELIKCRIHPPICHIEDPTFREHFGMNKVLMENLFREIHRKIFFGADYRRGTGSFVASPKKVLLTTWILCTREPYRKVSDRFSISKGRLHDAYVNTCLLIKSNSEKFIHWPDVNEQETTVRNFESKHGFPGVVGAIGEYVVQNCIKCGSKVSPSFFVLQAACDATQHFIDMFVTESMDFQSFRVLRQTPLFSRLNGEESTAFLSGDYHLIGDSTYPLMNHLLVPYKDDGILSPEQLRYNEVHDETYEIIRKSFARLVGRFKRLDYLHMSRSDLITTVIQAACCLHNYIVEHEDVEATEYDPVLDDTQCQAFVADVLNSKAIENRDLIASLVASRERNNK